MSEYIEIPIETDPDILQQEAYDFLEAAIPGWVPNDANLETIIIEALSHMTAEGRDVASAVPTDIFRYFGELVDILPIEAVSAVGTTDWVMIDNLGYTIPIGTQVGIQITGDVIVPFETTAEAIIPPGSTTANGVPISAIEPGTDASDITGPVTLLDTLDFVTSVTLVAPGTDGGVDAETDDAYLNRLRLRLQLLAPRPILPRDFAIMAQDIAGVERATAIDLYNPAHNLLTANQSSLETDTTGWLAGTNCVIARDTTQAADGTANLRLTSSAAGNMSAVTTPLTQYAAVPYQQFAALAIFRAAASARSVQVVLDWYTSGSVYISTTQGSTVADTTTGWTWAYVIGTAPATAAFVRVQVVVVATGAASEVHYIDKIVLRHGNNLDWAIGGTGELNNERMVAVAVVDIDGNPVATNIKNEVDQYLEDHREVNFIVNIMDPSYTTIDVQYTVKLASGFDAGTIEAATEQAVADYLSPANWGLPGASEDVTVNPDWVNQTVIRYLELAQVINDVVGVDYIVSLQFRVAGGSFVSTDITLTGAVPLPLPGAIAASITL